MKPVAFDLHQPATVAEAVALLARHGGEAKLIAGGQSLVPAMNFRLARPGVLVDLGRVEGLRGVRDAGDALVIGALTPHAAFHEPVSDDVLGRLLARVVRHIAHHPIRQRGTFGGSLCHADPASEWCLVAATLGAVLRIEGAAGPRDVAAADFFRGSFTTAVGPEEVLTGVTLPKPGPRWRAGFYEFARRKGDFALAMALAAIEVGDGVIAGARIGLGAVSDRPRRLPQVEALLIGRRAEPATFAEAGALASSLVDPLGDIHGSAEYRKDLAGAVLERALAAAMEHGR